MMAQAIKNFVIISLVGTAAFLFYQGWMITSP
jgi:hypothetical protein